MHLVITDSGLGGLSICAGLERHLRLAGGPADVRLTYVNAWPEQHSGYNDLPDVAARAAVFDRALDRISRLAPDRIVIACNTLSIVYGHTRFGRTATIPVLGIVDAGVSLFREALEADPDSSIVLFGTKTTIESGVHRDGLGRAGVDAARIISISCHGLATAIEASGDAGAVARLIDQCTTRAGEAGPSGRTVYAGLCCTHYGYVEDDIRSALELHAGKPARTLDPNVRLLRELAGFAGRPGPHAPGEGGAPGTPGQLVAVEVISKVELDDTKRNGMARRIESVSPATAAALLSYTRVPGLF